MSGNFPIRIDVEEEHLGSVLRNLDGMNGVVTIHLQLKQDSRSLPQANGGGHHMHKPVHKALPKATIINKGGRRAGTSTVRSLIAKALSKGAMHSRIIGEILSRNDMSPFSVNSALTKMLSDKAIVRVGPGTYRLTPLGERRYLEGGVHVRQAGSKGLKGIIIKRLMQGTLNQSQLSNFIADSGYSRNNMYNLILKMREGGHIRRNGDEYEVTDVGRKWIEATSEAYGPMKPINQIEHKTGEIE